MITQKLATMCLEKPWALPVEGVRQLMEAGGKPDHTFEEALKIFKDKIKNRGLKWRVSYFYQFRDAAKDLPELQPAVEELAKYDGDILNNKMLIDGVNEIYDCVNNFKRPPVVESSFLDLMDLYFDAAIQVGEYFNNPIIKKISFINCYAINVGNLIRFKERDSSFTGRDYPRIYIGDKNLPRIERQVWKAIHEINAMPRIFHFKGEILRLLFIDGVPTVKYLNRYDLRHVLHTGADFYKLMGKSENFEEKPDYPSADVCEHILSTPDPPLPVLERIVHAPYYQPDGILVFMPGYSSTARCFYDQTCEMSIPRGLEPLSKESLEEAKRFLLFEVLGDFPFQSDADRAHVLSLGLHPFVRQMIAGSTPIYIFDSSTPGTGKTLLVKVWTYIHMGRNVQMIAAPSGDDEYRKRITSTLATYPTFFIFDNITKKVDSGALSLAITAPVWQDRLLSKSKNISIPVNCAFVLTGNNIACSTEIARRSIWIRMDARMEKPWQRENFRHPDLMGFVKKNRGRLIWAFTELVENWIVQGKPKPSVKPLGGFESYSSVVGGILEAAGIPGFLGNLEDFYDKVDVESNFLRDFTEKWDDKHKNEPVKATELMCLDIPMKFNSAVEMGVFLSKNRDRKIGKFTIRKAKVIRKVSTWCLEKAETRTIQ